MPKFVRISCFAPTVCFVCVCLFCLFQVASNAECEAVKEVFPYLSNSTIDVFLKEFGNDSSAVIRAILEERLPYSLKSLLDKERLQDEGWGELGNVMRDGATGGL